MAVHRFVMKWISTIAKGIKHRMSLFFWRRLRRRFPASNELDKSANESNKSAESNTRRAAKSPHKAEKAVESFEFWERVCGIVVILGVAWEYVPKFGVFLKTPHWTLLRVALIESAGGIAIALGIAAE